MCKIGEFPDFVYCGIDDRKLEVQLSADRKVSLTSRRAVGPIQRSLQWVEAS